MLTTDHLTKGAMTHNMLHQIHIIIAHMIKEGANQPPKKLHIQVLIRSEVRIQWIINRKRW